MAKKRRKRLWWILLPVTAALLALWVVSTVNGWMESFFYLPVRGDFPTPTGAEDVAFPTTDGLTLHGWFIPAAAPREQGPAPAILFAHGNAGNLSHHYEFADFLPTEGLSVFIFDYRSYGRSDRSPRRLQRDDLIADTNAALDYLLTRPDVDRQRIGLCGFSLGATLGLAVAAERPEVRAVVSISSFSRWKDAAADHAGFFGRLGVRSGRDAVDSVRRLGSRPLLILHGEQDRVVRPYHAQRIEQAAAEARVPVQRRMVPGAEHVDVLWVDPAVQPMIREFFRRCLHVDE
jgi:dienelactone hydrolase